MGWKKLIFGEKMPDKEDPKFKDRYEREVEAGKKAARFLRLDKAAVSVQAFANSHPRIFMGMVVSAITFIFAFNAWRVASMTGAISPAPSHTAVETQERVLKERRSVRPMPAGLDAGNEESNTKHNNDESEENQL